MSVCFREMTMHHRQVLAGIGDLKHGAAVDIQMRDLVDAVIDKEHEVCGVFKPMAVHRNDIERYAKGLEKYGVKVGIKHLSDTITIYKPQEPRT